MSEFLSHVLPFVPGCPPFLAIAKVKSAIIEYCERTKCWRHLSSGLLSAQGQALISPLHASIHLIEEATLDGRPLTPVQFTDASPDELTGETMSGIPSFITQIEPGRIQVYPFVAGGTLRVSAFLKPRADALYNTVPNDPFHDAYAVAPDFLLSQDAEAIANGAIYRLKIMPEHNWTDVRGAAIAREIFNEACTSRFGKELRGQQRAPIRTKAHWM